MLAKILGVYSIGYRNTKTGNSKRLDVIVMENLLYGHKSTKVQKRGISVPIELSLNVFLSNLFTLYSGAVMVNVERNILLCFFI